MLAGPLRTEGRQQMLAVGVSGKIVYPVDKGSGSITTLALADGVIEIPAGVEYLASGAAVEVKLFQELRAPDLVVAGENSIILERLAESLPWQLMLLNTGSLRGRVYLEDGVADLAALSSIDTVPVPDGLTEIKGYKRELGLIYRDAGALSDHGSRIVGWHRDSVMLGALERALLDLGRTNPRYVRLARTHSAVAAAVASRRADLGFGERAAAVEAGLNFKFLEEDRIHFLGRPKILNNPWLKSFIGALWQE
jgi:putative molybdopterin biosynthesis protein